MILQDPMTALDPCFTVRSQLAEPLHQHRGLSGRKLDAAIVESLEQVRLLGRRERLRPVPAPAHRRHAPARDERDRAGRPAAGVLIADEPTTALDVTTQVRYLRAAPRPQAETGFALLLVAHDLFVVRHVCERVVVMYAGEVVEEGAVRRGLHDARATPTRGRCWARSPSLGDTIHLEPIEGQAPDVGEELAGCRFAPRCRYARDVCADRRRR